jgi:hypothetical protein
MSETKRKIFIIIVLLLVILFGVGQFFAGANLNTAQPPSQTSGAGDNVPVGTRVVTYEPPVITSGTPVVKGSCFGGSIAAPWRADAWRCTVGNAISDPCFAIRGTSDVLCDVDPADITTTSTFVLEASKLPNFQRPSGTPPTNWAWLVELTDGTLCAPFTGTRPFAASGEAAVYSCKRPAALVGASGTGVNTAPVADLIFGDLNNATSTWTAELGALSTATSSFPPAIVASATVPVYAVWQ